MEQAVVGVACSKATHRVFKRKHRTLGPKLAREWLLRQSNINVMPWEGPLPAAQRIKQWSPHPRRTPAARPATKPRTRRTPTKRGPPSKTDDVPLPRGPRSSRPEDAIRARREAEIRRQFDRAVALDDLRDERQPVRDTGDAPLNDAVLGTFEAGGGAA